jgi:NADH-quinone oxidoreductase subunit M
MFALNSAGITGSVLQMINHGLSTGALFLLVGMLYERYHTRKMSDYGGMASRLGWLSAAFVFVSLSSVGLPGLNGFVGEALVFFGMFDVHPWLAVFGAAGIILGAWYLMTMLRIVFFGTLKEPAHDGPGHVEDLNGREIAALAPILTLCLLLGVFPQTVIDSINPDVQVVVNILQKAQETQAARGLAVARNDK